MPPLDTILFDMGGTLDGRGGWRERSLRLFLEVGLDRFSRDQHMAAFDYADAQSHRIGEMAHARLRDMVRCHIGWQLEVLQVDDADVARELVDRFASGAEQAAVVNRRVLATLKARGYRLGLVSNACGNVAALCDEFGYSPSLSAVVDSHWFGRSKPDPAIFTHALQLLDASAERTGFVGDSLDHDIRPARQLGMTTFWVADGSRTESGVADVMLDSVAELPDRLPPFEPVRS
jgi:HAD superfamily hydrolase (TIGR01509 family)